MSEITLNSLPKTLDELKAMPQAALTVPEEVAALTVAALALYPENPAETEKMLDFLRGLGVATVHLGTQTAGPFYEQVGFRVTRRLIPELRNRRTADGRVVPHDLVMLEMDL